jgi:acetate kinase
MTKTLNQACVLAINGDSSSIKFSLYQVGETLEPRLHGERDRARIRDGPSFLGTKLNESRNVQNGEVLSTDTGRATVRVIRTDEEQMIARSVCRVLGLNLASEERNSDHATTHVPRLDAFSAGGVPP